MTPNEWNAALAADRSWPLVYSTVEAEARRFLIARNATRGEGGMLSTSDLVERLFPAALARGEGVTTRLRLFKSVIHLAKHSMADCCMRDSEPKKKLYMGHKIYGWLWHAPAGEFHPEQVKPKAPIPRPCPHCGCDLNEPPKQETANVGNDHREDARTG